MTNTPADLNTTPAKKRPSRKRASPLVIKVGDKIIEVVTHDDDVFENGIVTFPQIDLAGKF